VLTFIELCAGTAAVSLRLHHPRARPPVSRMGAKTGYADTILRVLGLRPGQRADRYVWCEPDPGVRLLLETCRDEELAIRTANVIRGWQNEEPEALWYRLSNLANHPSRVEEIAAQTILAQWAFRRGEPLSGFNRGVQTGRAWNARQIETAERVKATTGLPAVIRTDARNLEIEVFGHTVVFIDPPYENTTGYIHDFPRSEWLPLVRAWKASGATVCISEAEPIPELVVDGWHAVEITGERKGQKRTFSKQQAEWLTLSHPPKWRPSVQQGLFAC